MRQLLFSAIALCLSTICYNSSAQNSISGIVYFSDIPIKNAKIILDNTTLKSDVNGYFQYDTNTPTLNVKVSFKGSKTSETFSKTERFKNITLVPAEKILAKLIKETPTIEKCNLFLINYATSSKVEKIKEKREELLFIKAYDSAVRDYNTKMLEDYVQTHPSGKYTEKAKQNIEIVSWQKARTDNTIESYKNYIKKFPSGSAIELAKQKIEELSK